jgi:hypothetical protein
MVHQTILVAATSFKSMTANIFPSGFLLGKVGVEMIGWLTILAQHEHKKNVSCILMPVLSSKGTSHFLASPQMGRLDAKQRNSPRYSLCASQTSGNMIHTW